jgi:hypothetical protein
MMSWKWLLMQSTMVFSLFLALGLTLLAARSAFTKIRRSRLPD